MRRGWLETRKTGEIARDTFRHQIFYQMLNEYSSPEFGVAQAKLNDYYKVKCNGNREILVEKYAIEVKLFRKNHNRRSIHMTRRTVSNFYQRVAVLYINGTLPLDLIKTWFGEGPLKIIPMILEPLEAESIPKGLGNDPVTDRNKYPQFLRDMICLSETLNKSKQEVLIDR